jgi:3,4-dihydroxy-2-butanone 4-phosphate synthase
MKATLIALLVALSPTMATAENDTARSRLVEFKELTTKIEELERALRLQTLTTQAVRQDNYDLACKAQKEATTATHRAKVKDVASQSDMQFAEICTMSRATAKPTPSWLTPLAQESN